MSHQFKAGDFALIVGSRLGISPNIGKAVELIQLVMPGGSFTTPDGFERRSGVDYSAWMVVGEGLVALTISGRRVCCGGACLIQERYLMPLQGDTAPTIQKSQAVPA
ncbi:hypothetical protein [Pseudomonas sp. CCC4.4]|uniref:hypothetical protein n=1 Tax=Pseudomonas sp. CCC4.4 TaxID=3048612 RepID=UPI002B230895|nr:hypothetical protein [Pseudomonas sp. CCC4.4]MEB0170035.1 hypothetical protein [Pseudomonas sp. CCC4.4]